ncbi:MAG: LptE family protein [Planctomycetota bacterium]
MIKNIFISLLCLILSEIIAGCGYTPHFTMNNRQTIAVSIFDNRTLRRGHEFELTNVLERELKTRTPLTLVTYSSQPDLLLIGEITDYTKPALVEDKTDRVIQSQVSITIKVTLKNLKNNRVIFEKIKQESAELIGARAENEITARTEVYEKLSRWTVSLLENTQISQRTDSSSGE